MAFFEVLSRTQAAAFKPPWSVYGIALTCRSTARVRSSTPPKHRTSINVAARTRASRLRLAILARTAPSGIDPKRVQKEKNLVLSQSQGWNTKKLGTMNHSQIGASRIARARDSVPRQANAATSRGMKRLVFLSQNQTGPSL